MVTLNEFLNNLKGLLDKFYTRTDASNIKVKNSNNQLVANTNKLKNGIVVTDNSTGELILTPSISASTNMITGLSPVATSGNYSDLNDTGKPTKLSDFTNDIISYTQSQGSGANTYTIGSLKIGSTTTTLYGLDTNTTYTPSNVVGSADTTNGTVGDSNAYARANHTHKKSDLYAPKTHTNSDGSIYGKASSSVFGHSKATTTTPSNVTNGNASVGTDNGEYARYDHQHKIESSTVMGLVSYDDSTIGKNSSGKLYVKNSGIGTDQLGAKVVTGAKLGDSAVTTDKISNGTIKLEDLNSTDVSDNTVGGTEGSSKLLTSDAFYKTLNDKTTPPKWLLISEKGYPGSYYQKLWYNPVTGMVELYMRTPYRIPKSTNTPASYLVGEADLNEADLETVNKLESVQLDQYVKNYAPMFDIFSVARGVTTGATAHCVATLDRKGKLWLRTFTGGSGESTASITPERRYEVYFTYRCKLNRDESTDQHGVY